MAALRRTSRSVHKPERLGVFAPADELQEFEQSASEEEGLALRPAKRRRSAGRRSSPARQPRASLGDVLALAPLQELLAQEDAVQCLPLVAADMASCLVALGARTDSPAAAAVWTGLAERHACYLRRRQAKAEAAQARAAALKQQEQEQRRQQQQGDESGSESDEEVCDFVALARRLEPAPPAPVPRWVAAAAAALDSSMDKALAFLREAEVPRNDRVGRRIMVESLTLRRIAHRKFGDAAGLQQHERTRQRRDAKKRQESERDAKAADRLLEEGINPAILHEMPLRSLIPMHQDYSWSHKPQPLRTVAAVVAAAKREVLVRERLAAERIERTARMARYYAEPNTPAHRASEALVAWVAWGDGGKEALPDLVAALKAARAQEDARRARQMALDAALDVQHMYCLRGEPVCRAFVEDGTLPQGAEAGGGAGAGGAGGGRAGGPATQATSMQTEAAAARGTAAVVEALKQQCEQSEVRATERTQQTIERLWALQERQARTCLCRAARVGARSAHGRCHEPRAPGLVPLQQPTRAACARGCRVREEGLPQPDPARVPVVAAYLLSGAGTLDDVVDELRRQQYRISDRVHAVAINPYVPGAPAHHGYARV
eukprot:scaffold7.g3489.t1